VTNGPRMTRICGFARIFVDGVEQSFVGLTSLTSVPSVPDLPFGKG
jgi:hypothetical protein